MCLRQDSFFVTSRSLSWKGTFWFDFAEAEGGNPLHVAASEGHVLTAHILVQAGAELDALDDEQNTPLMLACHYGQGEVVKYLLQAGADMTLKVIMLLNVDTSKSHLVVGAGNKACFSKYLWSIFLFIVVLLILYAMRKGIT